MAKTMRNVVITAILLIAIAIGASALVLTGGCTAAFSFLGNANPFSGAQVAATNLAIDQLGIKDRINSELHARAQQAADEYGIPIEVLNAGIDDLAIQDWEAVEKPAGVVETGNYKVDANGTSVGITTYDDASVVGVSAYGIDTTLAVPESAQPYTSLIPLLDYQDNPSEALSKIDYESLLQLAQ